MLGPNPVLEKTMTADGAVTKYRIVKKGSNEDDAAQGSAATDASLGISQHDAVDNEVLRIMLVGISKVEFGGTVAQGDLLTSDANGKAVAVTRHTHSENAAGAYTQSATTGVGSAERAVGIAMSDAVSGDIGTVLIQPSFV